MARIQVARWYKRRGLFYLRTPDESLNKICDFAFTSLYMARDFCEVCGWMLKGC